MDFSIIIDFVEHFNSFLSWNILGILSFGAFALLGLTFFPPLHDILFDMFNYIVLACIFVSLLVLYKLALSFFEFRTEKIKLKKDEADNFNALLSLTKKEATLIKFLFLRHSHSAWLPPDSTEALLLLHKGYIEVISKKRKYADPLNFYISDKDSLYKLNDKTIRLINRHKESIMLAWKKIKINKNLKSINNS